jgi:putative acetyltransferase
MAILAKHITAPVLDRLAIAGIDICAAANPLDWSSAHTLLTDYLDWLKVAGGIDALQLQPSLQHELADLSTWYGPPRGVLLLAYRGSLSVGLVGVQAQGTGIAEMKRLYVQPAERSSGLGEGLVRVALAAARDLGAHTLRLVTIPGLMDSAIGLYRRLGFAPTAQFGDLSLDNLLYLERAVDLGAERAA